MTNNDVNHRMLIALKQDPCVYAIGFFDISTKGEFFYRLSNNAMLVSDNEKPVLLDHISFHADGKTHLKPKKQKRPIPIDRGNKRLPIEQTGHQQLFTDLIEDVTKLPQCKLSGSETEVIFPIEIDVKMLFLRVDLASGVNIITKNIKPMPRNDAEGELLLTDWRGSGSPDKALFFSLFRYVGQDRTFVRRIFVPEGMGIAKGEK